MPLEEIKLAAIILGIILAYIVIVRPILNRKKQKVLERYLLLQSFSLNMQDLLLNYILQKDALQKEFMPGITYKAYVRDLQKKHAVYLSDKKYKKIKKNFFTFISIWTGGLLDKQEERLQKVQQELSKLEKELKSQPHREAIAN